MIINPKTAKMLSVTLKRRPLLDRAGIEQLTNYDYPRCPLLPLSDMTDRPGDPLCPA
jgi:hypothetical protein